MTWKEFVKLLRPYVWNGIFSTGVDDNFMALMISNAIDMIYERNWFNAERKWRIARSRRKHQIVTDDGRYVFKTDFPISSISGFHYWAEALTDTKSINNFECCYWSDEAYECGDCCQSCCSCECAENLLKSMIKVKAMDPLTKWTYKISGWEVWMWWSTGNRVEVIFPWWCDWDKCNKTMYMWYYALAKPYTCLNDFIPLPRQYIFAAVYYVVSELLALKWAAWQAISPIWFSKFTTKVDTLNKATKEMWSYLRVVW